MPQAWRFTRFGLDALERVERPLPTPGPGQVRLRMLAASLNYRDLLLIAGRYDPKVPLPLVPCSDGVGEVDAVGEGVHIPLGSLRMPIFSQTWLDGPPRATHLRSTLGGPLPGTLQTHLVVDAAATVAPPPHLDPVEAATLPCAGVTAWHALEEAGVGPDSAVLTLGTGGVSLFALQLARARGARVAITSSSANRLRRAQALGAAFGVDYTRDPAWGRTVARWAGEGVDAVIEVGGAGTLAQSLRATRVGGTIALIGVLAGGSGPVPLVHALMRSIRIQGIFVGSRAHTQALVDAMSHASIHPEVAEVHPFEEAPTAFRALEAGGRFGKVVVQIGTPGA